MKLVYCMLILFCIHCKPKPSAIITLQQLGHKIFYDNKLSYNQTKACVSCHDPKFAFTDGYKKSIGSQGDLHQRNSKPLFNLGTLKYFTASDSTIHNVLQQMQRPMFNTNPIELGWKGKENEILNRFNNDAEYQKLFLQLYNNNKITLLQLQEAIAAYVLSIESYNSKYDAFLNGNKNILKQNEIDGKNLFFDTLHCNNCHGGKNFDMPLNNDFYANTGLYNIDANGSYPLSDVGLMQFTKQQMDMGKFKIPTLRNLSYTAPYYHDGSTNNLLAVLRHYNDGGRIINNGENAGNGIENKYKSPLIKTLHLSKNQQLQLLSFLLSLNDSTIVNK